MTSTRVARRYFVEGLVQGVGFRYATQRMARRLDLTGFVRNLPDGRVEVVVEGPPDKVKELESWLHHGPPMARVDRIESFDLEPTGQYTDFSIRF